MRWTYRAVEVDASRICPSGIVHRPVATISVRGASGTAYLRALVDTGADHTLLPFSVAENIGAELFLEQEGAAAGISGHEITIVPGRVVLELIDDTQTHPWSAVVGFAKFPSAEDECSISGHAACLELFEAIFNGVEKFVELIPRANEAT